MFGLDAISVLLLLHFAIAIAVCVHILMTKHEAAVPGWIALVLVSPFVGSLLYWILGINRVERRAHRLRGRRSRYIPSFKSTPLPFRDAPTPHQQQIFNYEYAVHDMPFLGGNQITPLIGVPAAIPSMLDAVNGAQTYIALSVYIFQLDDVGKAFVRALKDAHQRGVKVYVLVDEIGSGRSSKAADRKLAAAGISTARFIPQKIKFLPFLNLRNHRKVIIIDGSVGFIGGMNICRNYQMGSADPIRDLHFRVTGPVLEQMGLIFEEDWRFATGSNITLRMCKDDAAVLDNPQFARVVPDGPDNAFQRTLWIMLGALTLAQRSVHIVTPYFLPNEVLTYALSICAMRGVDVRVIVPKKSDIWLVDWAMRAKFQSLIEHGVKIFLGCRPFDHSKLLVVDDAWILVGSSNWDQRSLRLNFEANLECYDVALAGAMEEHFQSLLQKSELVSLKELQSAPFRIRLRNNIARVFTPYL